MSGIAFPCYPKYPRKLESVVEQWNKVPMEIRERREKWIPAERGLHRIRVTVANKFELSCNIDRPFCWTISLPPTPPLSLSLFSPYLLAFRFIEILCGIPMRSDSKVLSMATMGGRTLYYAGKKKEDEGPASISLLEAIFHFPAFQWKRERDSQIPQLVKVKK